MKTIEDLISRLDRLNYIDVSDKKLIARHGFEVSYSVEMSSSYIEDGVRKLSNGIACQIVVRVFNDGIYMASWGCESEEDNAKFLLWWIKNCSQVSRVNEEIRDNKASRLKLMWNSI